MSAADKRNMNTEQPTEELQEPAVKRGRNKEKVVVDRRAKNLRVVSVSSVIFFVAIVLVINLVFDSLLGSALTWDWSPTASYTLGDTTKTITSGLTDNVRIVALFNRSDWTSLYTSFLSNYSVSNSADAVGEVPLMLDEYARISGGKVTVDYIDPVKAPSIIKELDPDGILGASAGSFVVTDTTTKKSKLLSLTDMYALSYDSSSYSYVNGGMVAEQAISGAIQFVTAKTTPVVYFMTGHGEADYQTAYAQFSKILRSNNFDTKVLDIRVVSKIPDDAALLVFLDPILDITSTERALLHGYLTTGGRMLMISGFSTTQFTEINKLLVDFNIELTTDRVREGDTSRRFGQDPYTFLADVPKSVVASSAYQLILGGARRLVDLQNTKTTLISSTILTTSANGIAEPNGDANSPSDPNTMVLAMAVEDKEWQVGDLKSAKVAVIGSSALINDAALTSLGSYSQYNQYFIYYTMEWLTDASKNNLYIAAKTIPNYSLNAGNATSYTIVEAVVAVFIPLGLLLAALLVFRRRRHL